MWDFNVNIDEWDTLGVAVSGGRDSMALLHLVLSKIDRKRVLVINIEHGIRGEKSREESRFVVRHSRELDVECISIPIDTLNYAKENKLTTEQAARELRYREFNLLIDEGKVNKIALAHHKGDQAETIMMRILRGTGVNGLVGMSDNSERFLRPLLKYSRKEINHYIKRENIPYIDDDSNFNNDYTRNFIRNKVFPQVAVKFPDYENSLIRLSENAKDDNDYIMSKVRKPQVIMKGDDNFRDFLESTSDKINTNKAVQIPLEVLSEARSLAVRSIMLCFNALGIDADIERRHMDILTGMVKLGNNLSVDMPYDVKVYREYDNLVFVKNENVKSCEVVPFQEGLTLIGDSCIEISEYQGEGLMFDLDKIPQDAVIRFRQDKDYFEKFGGGGTKNLADYLSDKKIPRRLRDHIPLIAKDKEIFIAGEIEISNKVSVDKDTKRKYTIKVRSKYEH